MRFLLAGVVCWGLLFGAVATAVMIRKHEAAAARAAHPAPRVAFGSRRSYAWRHFPRFRNRIPVLAFHGIDSPARELTVTQRHFAAEMRALHTAGFHTVTIGQYARFVRTGSTRGLPSRPILLTFDDGRLDSYQGADRVLARYHFTAVLFVVAAWPDVRADWALSWNELARMQESGIWQIQEHAGAGHRHVPVTAGGRTGEYYAYRMWWRGHLESFGAYKARVSRDVLWGERVLKERIPGYRPIAFAIPYSNYGVRYTNDPRIARYFLPFLRSRFPVAFSGDYLAEEQARWSPLLSHRITMAAGVTVDELHCRLRDFALDIDTWREYRCLRFDRSRSPSVHSE